MADLTAKHEKVSGYGTSVTQKKDGYASGGPDDRVIGNKPGKTNKVGYTGPNVAKADRG